MSNRKRKAKKKFQKTAKPRPVTSQQQQLRLQQAIQAQSAGNLALAESEYRALIAAGVRIPGLFSNLAMICDQTGRRKEAQALWNKALSLDSGFLDARMQLANSYQKTGEIERSMEIYRRILSEQPRSVVPKYLLANLLKSQGKFEQATVHYEQIMALQPDYTQAHFS
jgi:tetratricopeptide (TPR) repeat protein